MTLLVSCKSQTQPPITASGCSQVSLNCKTLMHKRWHSEGSVCLTCLGREILGSTCCCSAISFHCTSTAPLRALKCRRSSVLMCPHEVYT